MKKKEGDIEKHFSDHVINNSRSMISIINSDYTYEKVNNTFCRAHNCRKSAIIGKSPGDIWGTVIFNNLIKDKLDRCLTGKTIRYKAAFNTPETASGKYQVTLRPIWSGSGKVTHIYADTLNITEIESLRGDNARLHNEIITLRSDHQNYVQKTGQLATVGLITQGIVHDFNNLIATISGYAELMNAELPSGSSLAEKAGKIMSASERARLLSERLLNISNHSPEARARVKVNTILRETIDLVRHISPLKIKFKTIIPEEEFQVLADPNQIFRVFLNLLTNAIEAMEIKGGTLTVKIESDRSIPPGIDPSEARVHIEIHDTGSGMTESQMKSIFKPYISYRTKAGGRGLGLYIVRDIINDLGGEIRISGKKNSWTRFDLYFPAC